MRHKRVAQTSIYEQFADHALAFHVRGSLGLQAQLACYRLEYAERQGRKSSQ
jgi:hypothetical protein